MVFRSIILTAAMLLLAGAAQAKDWWGFLYDPYGLPVYNIYYGANITGDDPEGQGRGSSDVDGLYWMGSRKAGRWSIGFMAKDGWPRLFAFYNDLKDTENYGRILTYQPNVYVFPTHWYDPWPKEIRQSFIATGTSINQVAFKTAGAVMNVSIHEGGVEPLGKQLGPERRVKPEPNNSGGAFWSAGLVPTVPGKTYTLRIFSADTVTYPTISPWRQSIRQNMSNPVPGGQAWEDGKIVDYSPAVTISSDDDGLISTVNTSEAYGHKLLGTAGQTFKARGKSVVGVIFLLGDSGQFKVSVHEGVGGKQIGPARHMEGIPWNGRTVVSWQPGEVPVKYGQTYSVQIVRVDNAKFAIYTTEGSPTGSDEYPNGCFYADGKAIKKVDMSAAIVEEASSGSAEMPSVVIDESGVQVTRSANSATIEWTTSFPVSGAVAWGTDGPYTDWAGENKSSKSHSITLKGLKPNTLYHYQIGYGGAGIRRTNSADRVFLTKSDKAANLLQNPGFEIGLPNWTMYGESVGLLGFHIVKVDGQEENKYSFGGRSAHGLPNGGAYQTVDVKAGSILKASTFIWTYQTKGNLRYYEEIVCGRIGIDPTGGTDPKASTVVWSPMTSSPGRHTGIGVEAKAVSGKATVFLDGGVKKPVGEMVLSFDDVVLTQE